MNKSNKFISIWKTISVDEDDIDDDVGPDNEPEPVSLATMLSAADEFDGYDEPY